MGASPRANCHSEHVETSRLAARRASEKGQKECAGGFVSCGCEGGPLRQNQAASVRHGSRRRPRHLAGRTTGPGTLPTTERP
eukprot:8432635-Lingulodinium_polyedra.AAC.1